MVENKNKNKNKNNKLYLAKAAKRVLYPDREEGDGVPRLDFSSMSKAERKSMHEGNTV